MKLQETLDTLNKRFGEGTIMTLGGDSLDIETIPTGCLSLDLALGVGGLPKGRITEIYGPNSVGKTTFCQHVIAEAQQQGGVCAFVDVEHAIDPAYARLCGVNTDELHITQPDSAEQALEITEALVRCNGMAVIVVDSVAALVPQAELEGEMGDAIMGVKARLMGQALRKITGALKHSKTVLIFTNQIRHKIGQLFGNPETTPGGHALPFAASVRLDIRRIKAIQAQGETTGNRTRITVKKNKVGPPFKKVEFDIMYNEGISKTGDILDLAVEKGIVEKRGSFFSYGETRLAQGRENSKVFLKENTDVLEEIEEKVRNETTTFE